MKKIFISMAMLLALCMVSCSDESKIERLVEDVKEACAERDFDKARMLAEKSEIICIKIIGEKGDGILYVNDKEIYYLLAENSQANADRIFYLYNAYEKEQLPDMSDVLEVAISQGNDYLAEKLIKGGVEPNLKVIKATVSAENEGLFDLIMQKKPELIEDTEVGEYYKNIKGVEAYNALMLKMINLEITNLRNTSFPTRPKIGTYDVYYRDDYNPRNIISVRELQEYQKEITDFNNRCLGLIHKCKDLGYSGKAKDVFSLMKENIECERLGTDGYSSGDKTRVKLVRNEINEAAKLLR